MGSSFRAIHELVTSLSSTAASSNGEHVIAVTNAILDINPGQVAPLIGQLVELPVLPS